MEAILANAYIKTILASIGTVALFLVGGIDSTIYALVALIILDTITGISKAVHR
jgi:phage-related holin